MTFAAFNLHPLINKAITTCGYQSPTPIQTQSIPLIMNGKDIAASAQTGTGKTGAFVLPILHRLLTQPKTNKAKILILTPTRELAAQITQAANTYGKFLKFRITSIVGGASYHQQLRALSQGSDIIIATPGRLLDHLDNKRVDLSQITTLILDEADRMLDMGFIDDVRLITKMTSSSRQTLLFSATLDNKLMTMVKDLLNQPVRIDLSQKQVTAPKIQQMFYKVKHLGDKYALLKSLLRNESIYKAIIFTATKLHADQLANELSDEGFNADPIHGGLKQGARNRTLEKFRVGRTQFLVATDLAARGIDINDITHVINFDLPKFCEDYVHRIGRTGRAGKTGKAISFVSEVDKRHITRIERYTGERITLHTFAKTSSRSIHDEKIPTARPKNEKLIRAKEEVSSKKEFNSPKNKIKKFSSYKKNGSANAVRFSRDEAQGNGKKTPWRKKKKASSEGVSFKRPTKKHRSTKREVS